MGERYNCGACGSVDTVGYWDIRTNVDLDRRSSVWLQPLFPDARVCADCHYVMQCKPHPRWKLEDLKLLKKDNK